MIEGIEYAQVSSIADILMSIDGQYSYVRGSDSTGAKSYNGTIFSNMKYMSAGYGYWIKIKDTAPVDADGHIYLEIEGARVPGNKPITLNSGWNLVGYLGNRVLYDVSEPAVHFPEDKVMTHLATSNMAEAFSSIDSKYSYVRGSDSTGAKSYNGTIFSNMHYVGPGYGYWIKVNAGQTPALKWEP
jgi:hypothetical protein